MAPTSRASRAMCFMQACRDPSRTMTLNYLRQNRQLSSHPRKLQDVPAHLRPSAFTRLIRSTQDSTNNQHPSTAASPKPQSPTLDIPSPSTPSTTSAPGPFAQRLSRPSYAYPIARTPFPEPSRVIHHDKLSLWGNVKKLFGWKPPPSTQKLETFNVYTNPYRARKKWPPDFRTLDPKQQFHLEKTYKRRGKLKWARPVWNKWVMLVQNTLVFGVVVYFVWFNEPKEDEGTPFDSVRVWTFSRLKKFELLSGSMRQGFDDREQKARESLRRRGWEGY